MFLHLALDFGTGVIDETGDIPVNPPPFRGSLPRKNLISCAGDINLPHTPFPPPNKKIKYNKIFTYILRSIFLENPHLELAR